ncbi:MAG: hypothetical protein WCX30_01060 [Candidatus Paceibacterota bacterium]
MENFSFEEKEEEILPSDNIEIKEKEVQILTLEKIQSFIEETLLQGRKYEVIRNEGNEAGPYLYEIKIEGEGNISYTYQREGDYGKNSSSSTVIYEESETTFPAIVAEYVDGEWRSGNMME